MFIPIILFLTIIVASLGFKTSLDNHALLEQKNNESIASVMLAQEAAISRFCQLNDNTNCNDLASKPIDYTYFLPSEVVNSPLMQANAIVSVYYAGRTYTYLNNDSTAIKSMQPTKIMAQLVKLTNDQIGVGFYDSKYAQIVGPKGSFFIGSAGNLFKDNTLLLVE